MPCRGRTDRRVTTVPECIEGPSAGTRDGSDFAARIRAGRRRSAFYGATIAEFYRKPYGQVGRLAGDAGLHTVPSGLGISKRFASEGWPRQSATA